VIDRARPYLGGTSTQLPGKVSITVTLSAGVAWIEPDLRPGDLLKQADAALYKAKLAGRNRALSIRSKGRPACRQARHH
jgi:diguanylate cyclase (GGDEF)-like protein